PSLFQHAADLLKRSHLLRQPMQHRVEIHDIEVCFRKFAQIVSRADFETEVRSPFLLRECDPHRQRINPNDKTCRTDKSSHILCQETSTTAHIKYLFP